MGNIIDISAVRLELGLDATISERERAVCESAIRKAEAAVIHTLRYDPVQRARTEFYPQQSTPSRGAASVWEDAPEGQMSLRAEAGAGGDQLQLKHLPLRSISQLYIDYEGRFGTKAGAFGSSSEKTEGVDYWPAYDEPGVCRDGILHSRGIWPSTPGSVKIAYTAGYVASEFHGQGSTVDATGIADACLTEASRRAKRAFVQAKKAGAGWLAGVLKSERLGDYSYTVGDGGGSSELSFGALTVSREAREMLQDFINWGFQL